MSVIRLSIKIFIINMMVLFVLSCNQENKTTPPPKMNSNKELLKSKTPTCKNHLAKEKSPYLLQHKDNPVCWYAWGDEAFEVAKRQDKPIFLSIGYSTCHWCHVMEKEVFEDEEAADLLNKNFIDNKVDREERPDIDKIYMDALHVMQKRGGWPLSIVMTYDKKPFFGGTYFPKETFISIMSQLSHAWHNNKSEIIESSQKLVKILNQKNNILTNSIALNSEIINKAKNDLQDRYDPQNGGFGTAPKFPPSVSLMLLLRSYRHTNSKNTLEMVDNTLNKMAKGGVYDHLGGGFHRYSTDQEWLVPHFEKMLYDNALLSQVYIEAYQVTKNKMYKDVATETLNYVLSNMTSPDGGFYSAQDADSEGAEGLFYVWKNLELKTLLTQNEYELFKKVYGISASGNFEDDTNIINLQKEYDWEIKNNPLIISAHKKLLDVRKNKPHPLKDTKIITGWNGLMITAMAKGYRVFGDENFLQASQKTALFIKNSLFKNGALYRRYRDNETKHKATLDDYAYLIQGLISLYQADFDANWLRFAEVLQKKQDELFLDKLKGGYFYTESSASDLIVRTKDFTDDAKPNSNAVSAINLLRLYGLTLKKEYKNQAEKLLLAPGEALEKYPTAFSQMLLALDYYLDSAKEIAIVGSYESKDTQKILSYLNRGFFPNQVVAFSSPDKTDQIPVLKGKVMIDGKTSVYVCEEFLCKAPTNNFNEFIKLVR